MHNNKFKVNQRLSVRPQTIKIIEENTGCKVLNIAQSNILLHISSQTRETKEKINKWDPIKLKRFCTAKEIINKRKRQPNEWENIFINETSDKGLISKFNKELIQVNHNNKTNN